MPLAYYLHMNAFTVVAKLDISTDQNAVDLAAFINAVLSDYQGTKYRSNVTSLTVDPAKEKPASYFGTFLTDKSSIDESAWFHTYAAAKKFSDAHGFDAAKIEESLDKPDADLLMDSPTHPWDNGQ